MSSGGANIEFYSKMESLVKDMDRLTKKQQEMVQNFDKVGKSARKGGSDAEKATAAAGREMDRFAAATTKVNATPLERYNKEMRQLKTALDAGKISQETFNRATQRAKTSLSEAGSAGQQAFGASAAASLKVYAAGMFSLSTAAAFVGNAMRDAEQKTQGAMLAVRQLSDARMALRQVATGETSEERAGDMQMMNVQADRLAEQYGIGREEARQLRFAARSEKFEGNEDAIARAAGAGLLSVPEAARVAGQVPGLFKQKISAMGAVNATLVAAAESRLRFEEIAKALPAAAEGSALLGTGPAETITLLSVLAGKAASGETGAARIKAFGADFAKRPEFAGMGILGTVEKLQAMPEEQRRALTSGSTEVNAAYSWMTENMPVIQQRLPKIERALSVGSGPQSDIAMLTNAALDPSTQEGRLNFARMQNMSASNELEILREKQLATGGFERKTGSVREMSHLERNPYIGPLGEYTAQQTMSWAAQNDVSAQTVQRLGNASTLFGAAPMESGLMLLIKSFDAIGSKLTGAADQLSGAAGLQERAAESLLGAGDTSRSPAMRAAASGQIE